MAGFSVSVGKAVSTTLHRARCGSGVAATVGGRVGEGVAAGYGGVDAAGTCYRPGTRAVVGGRRARIRESARAFDGHRVSALQGDDGRRFIRRQ